MDNRTAIRPPSAADARGARRGGHAFYADQARRALGIQPDGTLGQLRAPVFHCVVGVLVAGIAVLARPQRVGLGFGIALDVVLTALASLALLAFDRLTCPPEARPGLEGGALPTAALLAEALVLAGTDEMRLWVPAAVIAALVIAVAPHLSAMRIAGKDSPGLRVARDAAGVAVLAPVLIAACSSAPGPLRGFLLFAGCALTAVDALHTERASRVRALAGAAVVGVLVAGAVVPATRAAQALAATSLLVLWYGLRGLVAAVLGPGIRRSRGALLEYGLFVAVAGLLLANAVRH